MSKIPTLPESLNALRDSAISHVLEGTPEPNLQPIYDWLEIDGCSTVFNSCYSFEIAVDLHNVGSAYFYDEELSADKEIQLEDITDEIRLEYIYEVINKSFSNSIQYDFPPIYCYKLLPEKKDSPIIGCAIADCGPHGTEARWFGVFKDSESFYEFLNSTYLPVFRDIDTIPKEKLLTYWLKIE